jgi:serine/threonine-protein kinase
VLRTGERLGSFVVEGPLGQGGMGSVYIARDERLGRRVAIKVVGAAMASAEGRKRLIREARLMAAVDHPGIVPIYELGERDDEVYIVMELVRGRSLAGLLGELGAAPSEAVAAVGIGIAAAAAAAHETGILHRDIKPMNVMLRKDGVVKVLDFGIAKLADAEQMTALTRPGAVAGTPTYLAPELLNGAAATAASDIWSLGVTLAELGTGVLPFKARSLVELIVSVTTLPADTTAVRSDALRAILDKMLQKKPEERPASMLELVDLLEPLADAAMLRKWAEPALRAERLEALKITGVPSVNARPPGTEVIGQGDGQKGLSAGFADTSARTAHGEQASDPGLPRDTRATASTPPLDASSNQGVGTRSLDPAFAADQGTPLPPGATSAGPAPVYTELLDEIAGRLSAVLRDSGPNQGAPSGSAPGEGAQRASAPPPALRGKTPAIHELHGADDEASALKRITLSGRSGSRALNEDVLDELAGRLPTLPEPIALLLTNIEVARADGDVTGVRKRLFELGVGVVRYAVSAGLAVLQRRLADKRKKAPLALGSALRKAARMSDGQWADLGRSVANELRAADPSMQRALKFLAEKPLADLIASRNLFIHGGAHGDDAPERALGVLDGAEELLATELRMVAAIEPPSFELRRGTPIRAGVWRKTKGQIPTEARIGEAYLLLKDGWVQATPWLPLVDGRLLLVDSPHAAGKPWRSMDPESGEHREHPPLDNALKGFLEADASAPVPLTDRPPLVGRGAVIGALKRAAEEAIRGGVRAVILTGPFGIGRSHLAQTVVSSAAGLGFAKVLSASCSPERRSTLRPLLRALEQAEAGYSPKATPRPHAPDSMSGMERIRDAVLRAVNGDVLARREGIDSALEAVEEAIVETSLGEPTLFVVDDAQWADDQTLSLLRLLTERASRGGRGQLLLVITARDEPTPRPALRRLIGQLAQEVGLSALRVALPPLQEKDASLVVRGVGPVEQNIEKALVHGAAGVPFFLVQPLLVWSETGMLVWKEKVWAPAQQGLLDAPVPGVGDLIEARLGSFFDPGSDAERAAHQALACVALSGAGLPLAHAVSAMAAVGTQEAASEHALEALVEASLLRMDGDRQELRFSQSIVQQALLRALKSKPWFRRVHRALLDTVAAAGEGDAEASFLAAGYEALGAQPEAVLWLKKGIARAFSTGAFEEAIELAERLAKIAKSPSDRGRAEVSAVEALVRLGRAKEAREKLEPVLATALPGSDLAVEARILSLSIAFSLGEASEDTDSGLIADADACSIPRIAVEARLSLATSLRGKRGLELVDEALRRVRAVPEEQIGDLHYRLLTLRFEILWESRLGDPNERSLTARRAADAARALGSEWAVLDMDLGSAVLESDQGRDDAAINLLEGIARRAGERHFATLRRQALVNMATIKLRSGRAADAAETAREAANLAREAGNKGLVAVAQSIRAAALSQVGDMINARAAIDESVELKLAANDANVAIALLRRAEILAAVGEIERAMADAELALARAKAAGNVEQTAWARMWIALRAVKSDMPNALELLKETTGELEPIKATLRASTRVLVEEGVSLLKARLSTPPQAPGS